MSQSPLTADRNLGRPSREFVLDTDIGTDVDDLLALSMIFGSPELDVVGVTTVYGDVELRARIVAATYHAAGLTPPPIAAGNAETQSGRPVWWPGHEGSTIADLDDHVFDSALSAIDLLAASATVVAIGPLTNAAAVTRQPGHRVSQVVIMGGDFRREIVEHNIKCDIDAARSLFAAGVPVLAVGLEQTERVRLGSDVLARIGAAGPLGAMVAAEMTRFWAFAEQDYNVPHDPIAVLTLARPDLFEIAAGTVTVTPEGRTFFEPDPDGLHSIVTDMDVDAVGTAIVDRILAAADASTETASIDTTVGPRASASTPT
ncbi:nucleoside hydrolase [Microbacterium saperdae]